MASKKEKIVDCGRILQDRLTEEYFCVQVNNKPICLICNKVVSQSKNIILNGTISPITHQSMTNLKINLEETRLWN